MSGVINPAQQVAAALAALTLPDAPQREAANAWLSEFANTDAAWEAAVDLLDPAQTAELQFFGANMVLMKVRSSWQQLGAANQQQLYRVVRCHYHPACYHESFACPKLLLQLIAAADHATSMLTHVGGFRSDRLQVFAAAGGSEQVVLQRMCLALAAIAARSGAASGTQLVDQALQLAAASAASSAQVQPRTASLMSTCHARSRILPLLVVAPFTVLTTAASQHGPAADGCDVKC